MNLFSIAYKSIKQRLLSSLLTAVSVALGVMLLVAVLVFHGIVERSFGQESIFYDLIIGPKQGSDLQLVLATYYRITPATDTVPYRYYQELKKDYRVKVAIPIAVGDTTDKGDFPIVGTTSAYFTTPYAPGRNGDDDRRFNIRWKDDRKEPKLKERFEAIIGSEVAKRNDWDIGAQFQLIHSGNQSHVHKEKFTVVGVMQRTGTPNDKTVFVHLDDFYAIADHGKPEEEMRVVLQAFYGRTYTDEEWDDLRRERYALRELSAVFVVTRVPPDDPTGTESSAAFDLQNQIKGRKRARAVSPIEPILALKENVVGNIRIAMVILVSLIIAVSGVSIFVSIYNSMSDRKKEIAIMRALGARRQTVFAIILAESVLLCFGGGIAGILLGHGLVFASAPIVAEKTGLLLDPFAFERLELILLPAMIVMASLVGFVPGMTAYRTDVAEALGD